MRGTPKCADCRAGLECVNDTLDGHLWACGSCGARFRLHKPGGMVRTLEIPDEFPGDMVTDVERHINFCPLNEAAYDREYVGYWGGPPSGGDSLVRNEKSGPAVVIWQRGDSVHPS